ncbi:leucine-rich repeat domain-containing protein, partial [Hyella patelloides]|uniref:leucine-rich repeat domain-containing protein n=1 Tax=Hyella patelloides TaxID=1982969 RepID=UPI001643D353
AWLNLADNQLTTIPESLANLSNLRGLDLSDNQLTTIPESLANLSNLRWLLR